jgi:hypothetical protein
MARIVSENHPDFVRGFALYKDLDAVPADIYDQYFIS